MSSRCEFHSGDLLLIVQGVVYVTALVTVEVVVVAVVDRLQVLQLFHLLLVGCHGGRI